MFLLSVLSSVFPFLYGMLEAGTDLRFKCDNVKITTSIRKEGKYFYLRTTSNLDLKLISYKFWGEKFHVIVFTYPILKV